MQENIISDRCSNDKKCRRFQSILHCRQPFVRHAIQSLGHFRGVEEGENAKCLITEHEHTLGRNNSNNN